MKRKSKFFGFFRERAVGESSHFRITEPIFEPPPKKGVPDFPVKGIREQIKNLNSGGTADYFVCPEPYGCGTFFIGG